MDWLKPRLREIGKSGAEFARALGIPKSRVYEMQKGERRLQMNEVQRAARFLEMSEEELVALAGEGSVQSGAVSQGMVVRRTSTALPPLIIWSAVGAERGGRGAFMLSDKKAGETERPHSLEFALNAFAFQVVGKENEPVYRPRDTLIVNPDESVDLGDDCVFTADPKRPNGALAVVGRLIRITATLWIIGQYAASSEHELARKEWPHAWRIVERRIRK